MSTLTFPTGVNDGNPPYSYFGPNFGTFAAVPEPGSLALIGVALAAFGLTRQRKKT